MLFFPGWNTLLAGYLNSIDDIHPVTQAMDGVVNFHFWNVDLTLVMMAFMFAMGSSFILNQIADVETDRKNKKLFLIDENFLSKKSASAEATILILLSLGIGSLVDFTILLIILIFLFITAYLYNFKPFEFKNKPFSGLLLNSMMGWLAFALGWFIHKDFTVSFILASLPYLFLNTGLYLLTTLPDMAGDQSTLKKTFSVIFGFRKTVIFAGLLYLLSLIFAILLNDQIILVIDLLLILYFIKMLIGMTLSNSVKFIKMAIFFFSLLISFKFPMYLVVMISVYFLTRYYYRQRFNYDYPNFRGN
jgi:4-hydroxybenzoate polyprenyltransferase